MIDNVNICTIKNTRTTINGGNSWQVQTESDRPHDIELIMSMLINNQFRASSFQSLTGCTRYMQCLHMYAVRLRTFWTNGLFTIVEKLILQRIIADLNEDE